LAVLFVDLNIFIYCLPFLESILFALS